MNDQCQTDILVQSPPDDQCQNCKLRPATENWVGEGGTLAFVHGMYSRWCKPCVLETQIAWLKERTAELPKLETELAQLLAKEKANEGSRTKEGSGEFISGC